jgi:cysteine desulfurase
MIKPIYLDYNGTTPHAPEVVEAMRPFLEHEFGNPSSSHWYGSAPKKAVEKSRNQVAHLLRCDPEEIVFTSGGTESNNHAIYGMAMARKNHGNHIITSCIEHPAVLEVCKALSELGFETTCLPVDHQGLVHPADVEKAVRPGTILITIMHSNNEVGTIQPIEEISSIAKQHSITMHSDAAQSVGKVPVDVRVLGVDLLSVAGHKLYGPKGVGALYIRESIKPVKFMHGAGQESGWRAGTENVLEIVGLGKACEIAERDLEQNIIHMKTLRDKLHDGLVQKLGDGIKLNGHPEKRLPNTLNLSFSGMDANRILAEIGGQVAASAGAACHAGTVKMSHVLDAMMIPEERGKGTLRFSVGRMTTADQIDRAINVICTAVKTLKSN